MSKSLSIDDFKKDISQKDPEQKEFLQAVNEVIEDIIPYMKQNKQYDNLSILERLIEPERIIQFRVTWVDDKGKIQVNRGFRVQFNSALGPFKGGLRFHPSVNLSVLKFLGFEQTFKNALTGLPLGGGKGGSDFDPKEKSDMEIMRFCQAFMTELYKYIGAETDIPAGDIGVGTREIGYMFGQYKRITNNFSGHITGKGELWGGSALRMEATGYGLIYILRNVLEEHKESLEGKRVAISGSGNVALFAAQKAIELGGVVITLSDSDGCLHFPKGISKSDLDKLSKYKNEKQSRLSELSDKIKDSKYFKSKKPWEINSKYEIALPCATQNEIELSDAKKMVANGLQYLAEGANMPTHSTAISYLQAQDIIFLPGKAANAGGVAVSALEMSQNAIHTYWTEKEVDEKLHEIMKNIHDQCVQYGKVKEKKVDYLKGANIAGFIRVADAMIAQGVV